MNLLDFGFIHNGVYYVVIEATLLFCRCQYYDTNWALERTVIFKTRDVLKWAENGVPSE